LQLNLRNITHTCSWTVRPLKVKAPQSVIMSGTLTWHITGYLNPQKHCCENLKYLQDYSSWLWGINLAWHSFIIDLHHHRVYYIQ
jgi:hypothetical protein